MIYNTQFKVVSTKKNINLIYDSLNTAPSSELLFVEGLFINFFLPNS